jgi:hypothetical protein
MRSFVLAPEALVLRMTQGEIRPFCIQVSTNTAPADVLVGVSRVTDPGDGDVPSSAKKGDAPGPRCELKFTAIQKVGRTADFMIASPQFIRVQNES